MLSTTRARAQDWLNAHVRAVGIAITLCGLVWRFWYASDLYLSPDESVYYTVATHDWHGWIGFYHNAILPPHPPLFVPILQAVLQFGQSEWMLRFVPILAGSLFPLFVMLWLQRVAGNAAALSAQLLLTFSPSLIYLSTEVRAYTLAFLFVSISLFFLEIALDKMSVRFMIWFHVFLYLAILTEYCVAWFAVAFGAYALVRLWRSPESGLLRAAFVIGQVAALGLFLFLYLTHIEKMPHVRKEGMFSTWLQEGFARPNENPFVFALQGTYRQFIYMFEVRWLAWLAAIAFTFGLYRIWRDRSFSYVILLLLPFCVACLGALFHVFPYGATRHAAVLCIAIAAGSGIAFASAARHRILPILLIALPVIVLWNAVATQQSLSMPRYRHHLSAMHQATEFFHESVPPGSVILTDEGTDLMLGYYLGCADHSYYDTDEINRMRACGPLQFVVAPTFQFSGFSELRQSLFQARAKYHLEGPVWIAAGGFYINVENPASETRPFGKTIAIFKDSDLSATPELSDDVKRAQ